MGQRRLKITGGVFAPIVSPFDEGERLDIGAFRAIVEYLAAGGITGLLVAGTTSEAYTLDLDERRKVYQAAVQQSGGRLQILAGAGAITTRQAAEFVAMVADCGADAACILTPWFQQATPDGLESYFGELAELGSKRGLPLLFYHNPPRTGLNWAVEHIAKLANKFYGPFVGIKESTHNMDRIRPLRAAVPADFLIYSGNAHQQPQFRVAGSSGTIDPLANALPNEALKAFAGDAAAVKMYGDVAAALGKSPNLIATLKRLMVALGLPAGVARRPHHQVDPTAFEQVRKLASAGGRMAAGAADGASSPAATASQQTPVSIVAPGAIDRCMAAPAAKSDTVVLYSASDDDCRYNHHASLAQFEGKLFAAWSAGRLNEDSPGQVVRFATSVDGGDLVRAAGCNARAGGGEPLDQRRAVGSRRQAVSAGDSLHPCPLRRGRTDARQVLGAVGDRGVCLAGGHVAAGRLGVGRFLQQRGPEAYARLDERLAVARREQRPRSYRGDWRVSRG